jgi:hypothetical protein
VRRIGVARHHVVLRRLLTAAALYCRRAQLRLLFYLSVASQRALQILDWPAPSLLDMFEVSVVVAQELRDEDPDSHSWSACRSETWTGACPPTNR